jgi:hypothetical protein
MERFDHRRRGDLKPRRITAIHNEKRPPGNRAAFPSGRIVPTEAKPSELSGEILCFTRGGVKAKSKRLANH